MTRVVETHNSFLQIWVNWGILALAALLYVLWSFYKRLPSVRNDPVVALGLRALGTTLVVYMLFFHNFYAKEFAFVLGALIAERVWLRPRQQSAVRSTGPVRARVG